uniref:Solute carrier family 46 member 3 n=1 Tax=Plectus sambesii TaxID=2011161 RepID=A0A914X0N0_9BILA
MGRSARFCVGAHAAAAATTVEPLGFFIYGFTNLAFPEHVGFYRRVCTDNYGSNSTVDCSNLTNNRQVELEVQRVTADYTFYRQLSVAIPAIFADLIFGALGDKYGRQVNILIGIIGLIVSEFLLQLVLSSTVAAPLYFFVISGIATGITGYQGFFAVSAKPYLADTIADKKMLTVRLGLFMLVNTVSSFVGSLLGGYLIEVTNYATLLAIEMTGFVAGFFYILVRIKQHPPVNIPIDDPTKNTTTIAGDIWRSLKDGWLTLSRRRKGSRRLLIGCSMLFYVMMEASNTESRGGLISQYVLRDTGPNPLRWNAAGLSNWMGYGFLILAVGNILGTAAKHFWNVRDTTLLLCCIASSCARNVAIGLASETWHMYLSNVLGFFTSFSLPALTSFMSQIVEPNEIGKALALLSISVEILQLVEATVFIRIYKATLTIYPGMLYLLLALCLFLCWLLALWVRHVVKVEQIELSQIRRQPTQQLNVRKENGRDIDA